MASCRDFLLMTVALLGSMTSMDHTVNAAGEAYGVAYMNITQKWDAVGFIQIFGVSTINALLRFEAAAGTYNSFAYLSTTTNTQFNVTYDYDQISLSLPVTGSHSDNLGIVVTSDVAVNVYGVKSDRGTTDGFMSLPLLTTSTDFFLAGWPCNFIFYAGFLIIAALNDTCYEVYRVYGDSYTLVADGYLQYEFDVFDFQADCPADGSYQEDVTGYFVNTTKPVELLSGHSCANVPQNVTYCDYMVEQIPPLNQLGTVHIVPPIYGRNDNAGFLVRVVATDPVNTLVSWSTADGSTASGSATLVRGHFVEIDAKRASVALLVVCSKPCLVMQYNRGTSYTDGDVPTDPFMMLTIPIDHFDNSSGFATASFCGNAKQRLNFNSYVSIVALTRDKDSLLFDGSLISSVSTWKSTSNGYSVTAFGVSHGFHNITVLANSNAAFASYLYGHSIDTSSSSGYGYITDYKMIGERVTEIWQQSLTTKKKKVPTATLR